MSKTLHVIATEMERFALESHLETPYEQQNIEKMVLFSYWLQS